MKRKCNRCGRLLTVNAKNFYRRTRDVSGYRGTCKRCYRCFDKEQVDGDGGVDNVFFLMHEYLECVFRVPRSNYEGQMAIIGAIGGVLGRGF